MTLHNVTHNFQPPLSYECRVIDRANRKPITVNLCDLHLEAARKKTHLVLTGTVQPAALCDQCQIDRAEQGAA
jgi:hypothetical protein